MSKIADAAGLTQQGLLHYFPNKSALLLAVVAERERATAAFLEDDSGSGSVLDGFVAALRHNIEEPNLVELMAVLSGRARAPIIRPTTGSSSGMTGWWRGSPKGWLRNRPPADGSGSSPRSRQLG